MRSQEPTAPAVGHDLVYAMVITADWWTDQQEPFVAKLVPRELTVTPVCNSGDLGNTVEFDPATRVLTWSSRLDNPYIALKSCPLKFRIDPSVGPGTTFVLTATLATSKPDPNADNNKATIATTVMASSDLAAEITSDVKHFRPGATIHYKIAFTNQGPLDARDVMFVDHLSPHVEFVSFERVSGPEATFDPAPFGQIIEGRIPLLPAGSTATFRLVVRSKTAVEAADIANRVLVQSSSYDPFERNNEQTLFTFAGPLADLSIVSVRGPDAIALRVDCSLGALAAGAKATITVSVQPAPGRGAAQYTAFVSPVQNDPRPDNNHTQQTATSTTRRRGVRK